MFFIYVLPPPNTVAVSLTVCDSTHRASCKERSASSKICCVAPRRTMVHASPSFTPVKDNMDRTYEIFAHHSLKNEPLYHSRAYFPSPMTVSKLWAFRIYHLINLECTARPDSETQQINRQRYKP